MNREYHHNKKEVKNYKPRCSMLSNNLIGVEDSSNDARADSCLDPYEHEVAEVHVNSFHFEHVISVPLIGTTSLE